MEKKGKASKTEFNAKGNKTLYFVRITSAKIPNTDIATIPILHRTKLTIILIIANAIINHKYTHNGVNIKNSCPGLIIEPITWDQISENARLFFIAHKK